MYRSLAFLGVAALALPCRAEEAAGANETLVRLTVSPASAPKPALKYVLLPKIINMNPGNAAQGYLACAFEFHKFFFDQKEIDRREALSAMPLEKLPVGELRDYGGSALALADQAARLDQADWQVMLKLRADGADVGLRDVQEMRDLARALKVRFRVEVAERRFDDALRTAQTMFAISRHLGQHVTVIGNLAGVAIAQLTLDPLEEMLAQPDCPNLYWALSYLPSPLVPRDKGALGEGTWIRHTFRELDGLAPLSRQQHDDIIVRIARLADKEQKAIRAWLDAQAHNHDAVTGARKRLVESGIPVERLYRLPAEQIVLLDERRALEECVDDLVKLTQLPAWQASALAEEVDSRSKLVFDLAPGMIMAHWAHARLEQRLALLRHVEALRLYAAAHGALPATLSEIKVPLPSDPFCGQPFRYALDGATAHLRGTPPKAEADNRVFNRHYEVMLRK